jgi:hypothetical protein
VGVASDSTVAKSGYMNVNDLNIVLEPAGAAATALDTKMSVFATTTTSTTGGIGINMFAPTSNLVTWQGVRVRYRAVVAGTNPAFTTVDFKSATDRAVNNGTDTNTYNISAARHDVVYEMAITPLVFANGSDFQESKHSSYGMGYVSRNTSDPQYPTIFVGGTGSANWAQRWNWTVMDTGIATNTLNKTFDSSNPVASVTSCIGYRDAKFGSTTQYKIREFIELKYDCTNITGFQSLAIYRRNYNNTPSSDTTVAKYYGIGRWERIVVTASSGTVNLRLPTGYNEFDQRFGVSGYATSSPNLTKGYLAANGYPSGLANDNATNTNSRYNIPMTVNFNGVQLLLIVTANVAASTQALLIKGQLENTYATSFDFLVNSNGFAVKPLVVEYQSATDSNAQWIRNADFPDVNSVNYRRKIGDARTTQVSRQDMVVFDRIDPNIKAYQRPTVYGYTLVDSYPTPKTGPAVV